MYPRQAAGPMPAVVARIEIGSPISPLPMNSFIHQHGLLRSEEIEEVIASGAVADMLGKFFSRDGKPVPSKLNYRTPGVSLDDMARHEIVLLAAGLAKAEAAQALLRSGLINRLIVDGDLAKVLAAD